MENINIIKNLEIFKNKSVIGIRPYYNKRASSSSKVVMNTKEKKYFGKYIGENKAEKVDQLYGEITNIDSLNNYIPTLVSTEKGWVVYEWLEGVTLDRLVWRWLVKRDKRIEVIIKLLGKWLSNYHQSFISDGGDEIINLKSNSIDYLKDNIDLYNIPICKTYNDFTLKNILVNSLDNYQFYCLDIDAAFHERFPKNMFPYHDLSLFLGNLLSYSKVPVVTLKRLSILWGQFKEGYLCNFKGFNYSSQLLWQFLDCHNKGSYIDRPRLKMYSGIRNKYFRRRFKKLVSQGPNKKNIF